MVRRFLLITVVCRARIKIDSRACTEPHVDSIPTQRVSTARCVDNTQHRNKSWHFFSPSRDVTNQARSMGRMPITAKLLGKNN